MYLVKLYECVYCVTIKQIDKININFTIYYKCNLTCKICYYINSAVLVKGRVLVICH